ncbi:hypothetical protein FBU30_008407 [Linnemannia zychae]|nr:hypothetical protein FBU30_008407 [Linnemannia zychae]
MSDSHPSCIHSTTHHNSMTQGSGPSSCICEDCSRYKARPSAPEQSSEYEQQQQFHPMSMSSNTDSRGRTTGGDSSLATSASYPPTTYLPRRPSTVQNSGATSGMTSRGDGSLSPRTKQPAGFGPASARTAFVPQRRSSVEFHNRERSFQQHSTACDCGGSGVGCGCSFTCDC